MHQYPQSITVLLHSFVRFPDSFCINFFSIVCFAHTCFSYGTHNKQCWFPWTELTGWFLLWRTNVSCEVRTEFLYIIQMNFRNSYLGLTVEMPDWLLAEVKFSSGRFRNGSGYLDIFLVARGPTANDAHALKFHVSLLALHVTFNIKILKQWRPCSVSFLCL